jgi:hypothetical protein
LMVPVACANSAFAVPTRNRVNIDPTNVAFFTFVPPRKRNRV